MKRDNEEITVFTRDDLHQALVEKYGKITIIGDLAADSVKIMNTNHTAGGIASIVTIAGGALGGFIAGPLVAVPLVCAGMAGGLKSMCRLFDGYRAVKNDDPSELVVVRRKSKFDSEAIVSAKK